MDKIAVLIPCYNEEKTIEKVIMDAKHALPEAVIYVYNNNSTDNTVKIAQECGAVVCNEYMQGKGNVTRRMFREIDAECYVMVDGDDTYPLEAAPEMVDKVLNHNADLVVGDRLSSPYFEENKRPFHNIGNTMVRFFINRLFKTNVKDIMTGFRAFSYDFVKTFPVLSKGFEIETEMTIHALDKNFLLKEISVAYRDRPKGSESKLNTYSDGIKVLKTIFTLFRDYKPFYFFSILTLLFLIIGLLLFCPILLEYFKTGLVPRYPTLIVSGFIILLSMLLFSVGLILEVVVKKHRQLYEIFLINDK